MAVLDLIPAGAKCLCEAQLQAACVWFCPLIWDAIEYLGLEFTKEVRTLGCYWAVPCLEKGIEMIRVNTFSCKIESKEG